MTPESITAIAEAAAAAIAIARLVSLRLAGTFPALLLFLAVIATTAVAGSFLDTGSQAYFWLYTVETPFYCVLALVAGRELFNVVFDRYPGIRTAGKRAVYWGAGVACALSAAAALAHWGRKVFLTHLVYIELARRSIVLSVALFIMFILYSLSRFPLRLGRNVIVSSALFSILFLSQAVQLLIDSLSPSLASQLVDVAAVAFGAFCIIAWAMLLKPEPSRKPVVVKYSSEQEEHLLQQLDNLNRLLSRTARQ